jgi:predicted Zn-dependent protease
MIDRSEARLIVRKALDLSRAEVLEANLSATREAFLRFAVNTVTTAGAAETPMLSVTAHFGRKSGTASTNAFDDDAIARTVRAAEAAARLAPEDPEWVAPLGPQRYLKIEAWFDETAGAGPEARAAAAGSAIRPSRDAGLVAAGYSTHTASCICRANTKGLFAYHRSTNATFSTTVRTKDGTGSGWAAGESRRASEVDAERLSARARDKARRSASATSLEPGAYTVVLEPAAVEDLLSSVTFALSARPAEEGRSFFAKPGGGTRLGEAIFDPRVTLRSDPADPRILSSPFTGDGLAKRPMAWIEKGVLKNLSYDRAWAQKQGKEPTPAADSLVLEGEDRSLEDLVASCERGVLVTRFWYIRSVDPRTLLLTGLTRDGTFLIEKGKITRPVNNFRFNESPAALLKNVMAMSRPEKVQNIVVPGILAKEFHFSSVSDAV